MSQPKKKKNHKNIIQSSKELNKCSLSSVYLIKDILVKKWEKPKPKCVNLYASAKEIIELFVFAVSQAVTFVIEPFNTSAAIGSTGTLACIATDLGSDKVSWKKVY